MEIFLTALFIVLLGLNMFFKYKKLKHISQNQGSPAQDDGQAASSNDEEPGEL